MGEDFYGADDGVGGGEGVVGVVDNAAEGATDIAVALVEQAGGVGVAIESAAADFVFIGELADVFPVDEALVDFVLEVVAADAAAGLVAFERGEEPGALRWSGRRRRFCGLGGGG